ncbi:hypothetical protein MOQ_009394 [Trypanosoma cruzi marinkellei]|uniref:Uncharacterized protein n=1 Tax=Trypanosoma cruzi marinkellei TaxID=85056 RepID=K2MX08_TRYCR|nr:hypothetical protein MOQ_009394 [Trypanosoma cruzi marinkellei]
MIPARRLRLLLARALEGVPAVASPSLGPGGDLNDYLLKGYMRESAANEKLTELLLSISSLGIASREDWLRLKKVFFAHLPELSCRTVNIIFALLVEKSVCGSVECVRIQDKLAQLNFSKNLRDHECLQTLRCITNVGSRLSPSFIPHALESIQTLVKQCQTELLPTLSYTIGRLLTSKENRGIPIEVQHALLESLIARVDSIDCVLLSQSELIYLFWALSAFCSPILSLRTAYLKTSYMLLMQGIRMEEIKDGGPMDLLLLLFGLCPLLECSGLGNSIPSSQEAGLIMDVTTDHREIKKGSQGSLKRLLDMLNIVLVSLIQHVAREGLQNRPVSCVILEMLTWSNATKVFKNAQILYNLLICRLLYGEKGMWFCELKKNVLSEGEKQPPLVNYFLFDQRTELLDILKTRLSLSVFCSVPIIGFEKASVREIIVVLEALVYGNISESVKKNYLKGCIMKIPGAIRIVSRHEFPRIVNSIMKLHLCDQTIMRAIHDRCEELGIKNKLLHKKNLKEGANCHMKAKKASMDDWSSDVITLYICEKSLKLAEEDKSFKTDVPKLLENLITRKGMSSATETHCITIIRSLAKHRLGFKNEKVYQLFLTSIFSRVKTGLPVGSVLSLILDGLKAGVSCEALVDSLLWVGCRLLEGGMAIAEAKDVATYFVAAHELDALDIAFHPVLLGIFQREKAIDLLSPHLVTRLFLALCALGIDDRSLLQQILDRVESWCVKVVNKVEWSEEDWKASLVLVHALWTSSSEVVWYPLMQIAQKLVYSMIERESEHKTLGYSLFVASAAASFSINNDADTPFAKRMEKIFIFEQPSGFLRIVTSLFSEDAISFSLSRTDALLRAGAMASVIPQYSNITCLLIIAHAVQRLAQCEGNSSKKLTPLGVSLWRYCLKHVEKIPTTDNNLMTAVGFSIRFGASSQAFDRFMSVLIEKEAGVNMLSVCSIADGLVRTGKRRPVATHFVAHFSQRNCLDDLPAAALLSLLSFFVRDAERVSLGLARAEMLTALVWSSLSLKLVRLPENKRLWTLVDSVPTESRSSLLVFFSEGGLIDKSSVTELVHPVSTVLSWKLNSINGASIINFLQKVKISLDIRRSNEIAPDLVAEELLKKISERL